MKTRSRTEYSLLNILTGIGGYFFNTILGFVCRIVFVRCLAADYLGVNGLFTNILSMLSLAELGVGGAIVYALYKPLAENDEEKIASLMKVYSTAYQIIGLVVAVVGLAMMPFIKFVIKEPPNIIESIYLLYAINLFNTASTYFFSYRSSLLIASQRNYLVSGISYAITTVQSILQMIALLLFRNYLVYLIIQTIGGLAYNIIISYIATKYFPCILKKDVQPLPKDEKKALFTNVRDLMVYKVSGLLVNSTDNILITFFGGLVTTGIASNYTLLVNTLNSLLSQVFNGLTASIGNHNASETKEKQYKMFSFLNMMNFWIFGWAALGIYFCSSDLVKLCFGEEYVLSAEIPFIMAVNFFTVGMMNAVWTYKHTMGLFRYGRFLQIFTGIFNILFSVILGTYWGLFGVLAATVVARMLTNLWYDPVAVYIHGFDKSPVIYWKRYLKYVAILLIAALLCNISLSFITGNHIVKTISGIIICSITTNAVFVIAFHKTQEFAMLKHYINQILKRVTKHKR